MVIVETAEELGRHTGELLGYSAYRTLTQADFDAFGALSGDENWFHVDPERAAQEMPGGTTIAHGLFVLSLAPGLLKDIYRIEQRGRGLNYGYDRVRFIRPVAVNSRVRLALTLIGVTPHRLGTRIETEQAFQIEGEADPVLTARNIILVLK